MKVLTSTTKLFTRNVVSVGVELEYASHLFENDEVFSKLPFLEREFYSWQAEAKVAFTTKYKDLSDLIISWARGVAQEIEKIINGRVYLSGYKRTYDYGTVWNGFHIHIGNCRKGFKDICYLDFVRLNALVSLWKYEVNPTNRAFNSHHIWGYWRPSSYSFKKKPKFSPISYRESYNTFEVRILDFSDVYLHQESFSFLIFVISKFLHNKKFTIDEAYDCIGLDLRDGEELWEYLTSKPLEGDSLTYKDYKIYYRNNRIYVKEVE